MGGRRQREEIWGYMYMYSWFTLLYSRNEHTIVKQLYSNKNVKKEKSGRHQRTAGLGSGNKYRHLQGPCVFYPHPTPQREQRMVGPGEDHASNQVNRKFFLESTLKPYHPKSSPYVPTSALWNHPKKHKSEPNAFILLLM